MLVRLFLLFAALSCSPAFAGQAPLRADIDPEELSLQSFLQALETSISTMNREGWLELLSTTADRDAGTEFFDAMVPQGITRVVIKERDRSPLSSAPRMPRQETRARGARPPRPGRFSVLGCLWCKQQSAKHSEALGARHLQR